MPRPARGVYAQGVEEVDVTMRSVSKWWLRLATLPLVVAGAVFALGISGFVATFESPDYTRPLLPLPDVAWALQRARVEPAAGWAQAVEPPTTIAPLETVAAVVEPTTAPDKQAASVASAASAGPAADLPAPPTPQPTPRANDAAPTAYPNAPAKGGSTQPRSVAAAPVAAVTGTSAADMEPKSAPTATITPVPLASPSVTAAATATPGADDDKDKREKKNDRANQSGSHGRDR